ncbi:MAG: Ig-like domain-containing protein [Oscillospiraceae bacterium]|nr:Ig-like domain-containing protein [Oscillospiraceae bacterium]
MRNKGTINKKKTLIGYLTAVIALANMPFFQVSATNTPLLSIQNTTVQAEDISESRNIGVNLIASNNQNGFLASSFGIRYNENLIYTGTEMLTNAGRAFEIVCNPDAHLIWFVGGGDDGRTTASTLQEEAIATLYFDISENVDGGDFGLEFVWTGMDSSDAYWYADTKTNIIDELVNNSSNGKISLCNPDSEALNYTTLQLNPNAKQQLQIANVSGEPFWFSDDLTIAEVDQNGVVSAVSPGKCKIGVLVNEHLLTCDVTVLELFHYSIADKGELIMEDINTPIVLEYPDATEEVTWISANPAVVTVDKDGTLHAKQEGSANILATCNGKTYMRTVIVNLSASTVKGDATGDGVVSIADVVMLTKIVLGKESVSDSIISVCDFNGNGIIDADDSLTVMQIVVGLATG